MNLASKLDDTLIYDDIQLNLNLSFDKVLTVFEIYKDKTFNEMDKLCLSIKILINNYEAVEGHDFDYQANILKIIMDNFINAGSRKNNESNGTPIIDFFEDADYIFSSFYHDYGIDLIEQRGILHWQKFTALLKGLSAGTKMREVIDIRQKPIPVSTKYNAEEIRALREAKAFYALPQTESAENFNEGLDHLALILLGQSKNIHGKEV
jgi:Bacteriophage Gp15 protein.